MGRDFIEEMYADAEKNKYAIGHFNFSTLEILHAIYRAAKELNSPVILATSEGEECFVGPDEAVALSNALKPKLNDKLILHADHHKSFERAKQSVDAGYPSVHIDGSKLDYEDNVEVTKRVVDYAHSRDVWVEGELGHVGGASDLHEEDISEAAKPEMMTDPDRAAEFVEETGVDSLAVNVGNAHGVWEGEPELDFERLEDIKEKTGSYLVLHGGSGISEEDFRRAIEIGIDKVNINSAMRIAYAEAVEEAIETREDITPYHYMQGPVKAVKEVVMEKIQIFGSDGRL